MGSDVQRFWCSHPVHLAAVSSSVADECPFGGFSYMGMKSQLKNFVMTKFLAADSRAGSSTGASHVWRQVIRRAKQGDQKSEEWTMQDRP